MQKTKKGPTTEPEILYDFSHVQWHGAELDKLKAHLTDNIDLICNYPERSAETICRLLTRRLEVDEDELLVTDGGTGAIHLIARAHAGARSMIFRPTHAEFKHALEDAEHEIIETRGCKDLAKLELAEVDFCWLCTPNNPNGKLWSRKSILNLLEAHPDITFIADLSLASYVVEETIKPADINKYPNLIVVSSFSKMYNLPGLRVGYITAKPEIIMHLKKFYTPRAVGTIAMEAIRFILIHPAQFTLPIRKWLRNAQELIDKLLKIEDVEIDAGFTPFFVVRLRAPQAQELADYLLQEHKIKVGTAQDDIDLQPNEIRICARKEEANLKLVNGFNAFFSKK